MNGESHIKGRTCKPKEKEQKNQSLNEAWQIRDNTVKDGCTIFLKVSTKGGLAMKGKGRGLCRCRNKQKKGGLVRVR